MEREPPTQFDLLISAVRGLCAFSDDEAERSQKLASPMPLEVHASLEGSGNEESIEAIEIAISNTRRFIDGLAVTDLAGRGHVGKHLEDLEKRLARLLDPIALDARPEH